MSAAVLLALALPVLVYGLARSRWVWQVGLALAAVALATAFATRFAAEEAPL